MTIIKETIKGNSSKVTSGDPKHYANQKSARENNNQNQPAVPPAKA
ncbi:hypothetical protein [Propionispora vibrioides]|nr:hypothetical protein [Propionispora vibrioides]